MKNYRYYLSKEVWCTKTTYIKKETDRLQFIFEDMDEITSDKHTTGTRG